MGIEMKRQDECVHNLYNDMCYRVMRVNFYVIVGLLIFEICFMALYHFMDLMTVSVFDHFLLYLVKPVGLCSVMYAVVLLIIKYKDRLKVSDDMLLFAPYMLLIWILGVIVMVHYVFPVLYTSFMMPICLSVMLNNERVSRNIYLASNVVFTLDICFTYFDKISVKPNKMIFNIVCVYAVLFFTYQFVKNMLQFEKQKEDLIVTFADKNLKLKQAAYTDGLTGLNNFKMLEKTTQKWIDDGNDMIFCIIDIDDFKHVNDTYGHEFGNVVLKRLAQELKNISSDVIFTARYGGEEFSVLMKGTDIEFAWQIMDSLRRRFKTQEYRETSEHFSFSGGISTYKDGMSLTDLYEAADANLYKAKKSGKDKIIY